ncbi:MAG: aldo/keto reductase [Bacteroidota bacterium]
MLPTEKLILGTVQLGLPYGINNKTGKPSESGAFDILDFAYKNQVSYLDTAEGYGDSQKIIGDFHRASVNRFFKVTTKIGKAQFSSENGIRQHIADTIKILGVSSLEGYLFHSFDAYETFEYWDVLHSLVNERQIRNIGVSVYTNEQAEKAAGDERISLVQLPFNILDNFAQRGSVLALLKNKMKEVHVRSVFLQGLFFMKENMVPSNLLRLVPYLEQIRAIIDKTDLTINELALSYALQQPLIDKVLIGVDDLEQLKNNIRIADSVNNFDPALLDQVNKIKVHEIDLLNPSNW